MGLLALILAVSPAWSAMDVAERTRAIEELKSQPWPDRLAAATAPFRGTPYAVSPLGEGEGPDPDPLVRFDAIDCLTLVEEGLALSTAPDDARLVATLNRVRYSGAPSYGHRNHVMEAQWLPHLVQEGWLKDVTRAYGGKATRRVKKALTAATWKGKLGRSLALEPGDQAKGEFELDVIPAGAVLSALASAPEGLVLVVVRADSPSMVTRVSHVAVLVHGPQGPTLRHASSTRHQVVDEPLAHFLAQNRKASWALEGLAVYEPVQPPGDDGGR
jgi:hypothetical protein